MIYKSDSSGLFIRLIVTNFFYLSITLKSSLMYNLVVLYLWVYNRVWSTENTYSVVWREAKHRNLNLPQPFQSLSPSKVPIACVLDAVDIIYSVRTH